MSISELLPILAAGFLVAASPGPATLLIAGTSMNAGRRAGLATASGVATGSLLWSATAAFGLGALMQAHAWSMEAARYGGAAYLLYLALKSARAAGSREASVLPGDPSRGTRRAFVKGLALHLANPKPILFFGALFSVGMPVDASIVDLAVVVLALALQCALIFLGYALIFSTESAVSIYGRLGRWFETAFAILFGAAGLRVLLARPD